MEAIVPAFLLAALAQLGERPAALAAILADRFRRPALVALAAGLAQAGCNFLAAAASLAMAPMMTPEAKALFLAIALVFGGLGGLWPARAPDRRDRWRLGAFLTPFLGVGVLAFGERAPFFTLALALGGLPWLAAAGASLGCFAVTVIAAMLGERAWQALPLRAARGGIGLLLLILGAYTGLGALHLL